MGIFWDPVTVAPRGGLDPETAADLAAIRGGDPCWNARDAVKNVLVAPLVTTGLAALGMHSHHIFPNEFGDWFASRGITAAERNRWTVPLARGLHNLGPLGVHTKLGGNWNAVWGAFIENSPNASRYEILRQGARMMKRFPQFRL
jgi:hypothetical protein